MAGLSLQTGPTLEPVSLEEAKAHIRATSSEEDGLLAGYLLAARAAVEEYLGRSLINRTYDLKLDYFWPRSWQCARIILPRPPVVSVTSITYVDSAGANQTLLAGMYQLTEQNGMGVIVPAYGASWPTPRWQPDAATVRYVAGYGTAPSAVPEPIRQAILLWVAEFDANRASPTPPPAVQALLSPFIAEF